AVVAVGGAVFIRLVMIPTISRLPAEAQDSFRAAVRKRWAILYIICIGLLLLTGLYNYWAFSIPQHSGQGAYNALMGVKIILALVFFFIVSAIVGRSAAFESIRKNAPMWLPLNILLAAIVIAIAATLRYIPPIHVSG